MREYDINKKLVSNIEMSDEMKQELITNVKNGKRTSDKRFRYSSALMALCIFGAIVISGGSASAAYFSYKNRVENMTQKEQESYQEVLEADDYYTCGDSMTRELTKAEKKKLIKLQDEYYKNGVFPEESVALLDKLSELKPGQLAYVAEDNKLHLPEAEMTDEQILQFIDYQAKYTYTIEKSVEETESETEASEEVDEVKVSEDENAEVNSDADTEALTGLSCDVSTEDEEVFKAQSKELIKEIYGEELDDTWGFYVNGGKWSEDDDLAEEVDSYTITWAESDAPDAKTYVIDIPMNEDGNWIINKYGLEVFVDAEDYTWDEAQKYLDQGETAVKDFAREKLGLGEPDKIDYHEFQGECAWVIYKLHYGDKSVSISWVISTGDITAILGKDLMETE